MDTQESRGFGYNVVMIPEDTLLAISSLNQDCLGDPEWCTTHSIKLFRYHTNNPPYRLFSQVPFKKTSRDSENIMEEAERDSNRDIFGFDMFLSDDRSKISIGGYNMDDKSGFVKVYNVSELFFLECIVSRPDFIGDRYCYDYEPYYVEECGWDGGDCGEPEPSEKFENCFVRKQSFIGDDVCDDKVPYYTKECNYDDGDCPLPVEVDANPGCCVLDANVIGNGFCLDRAPYNSKERGWEGGDCLPDRSSKRDTDGETNTLSAMPSLPKRRHNVTESSDQSDGANVPSMAPSLLKHNETGGNHTRQIEN